MVWSKCLIIREEKEKPLYRPYGNKRWRSNSWGLGEIFKGFSCSFSWWPWFTLLSFRQPKYSCICEAGWTSPLNSSACVLDIDECSLQHAPCSALVQCFNTPGSFYCGACPTGMGACPCPAGQGARTDFLPLPKAKTTIPRKPSNPTSCPISLTPTAGPSSCCNNSAAEIRGPEPNARGGGGGQGQAPACCGQRLTWARSSPTSLTGQMFANLGRWFHLLVSLLESSSPHLGVSLGDPVVLL